MLSFAENQTFTNMTNVYNSSKNESNHGDISRAIVVGQYVLYSAISVVGLTGNALVCRAILAQRRKKANEYFILNLAITDLGTCGLSVPLDVVGQISHKFLFGPFLCRLIYPLQTIFMSTSVFTLLCLSIERYRAIVLPLQPKIRKKQAKMMLVGTWLLSLCVVAPYISVLEYKDQQCSENWPSDPAYVKAFTFGVFTILYLLPLLMISICYSRVLYRIYKDKSQIIKLMGGKRQSQNRQKLIRQRAVQNLRMVKLFVTAVLAFALCLLPFHVIWLWHDFGSGAEIANFGVLLNFSNILAYSNSVINPFIFGKIKLRHCCSRLKNGDKNFFSLRSNTSASSEVSSFWLRSVRERPFSDSSGSTVRRMLSVNARRRCSSQV